MIKIIFQIVKDEYKLYDSSKNEHLIIVNDDQSYLQSRLELEEIKLDNLSRDIKIVIQNKNYFDYYQDIEELGALTEVKIIDPIRIFISSFDYQLPSNISASLLIENSLLEEAQSFNYHYQEDLDFEINLLMYKLELKGLAQLSTLEGLFNFLIENQEKMERIKNSNSLFNLFVEQILINLEEQFLIDDLKETIINANLNQYFDFLLLVYILAYYKEHHFNRFISDFDFNYFNLDLYYKLSKRKELKDFYEKLYLQKAEFRKKISNYLRGEENKIDIFANEFEYSSYLDNISGYLDYEFDYIIKNLLQDLESSNLDSYHISLLGKIEGKFNSLFNFERVKVKFNQVKELFKAFKKLTKQIEIAASFEEWSKFYQEEYLNLNNRLEESKDIFAILNSLSREYGLDLRKIKNELRESLIKLNLKYEKFILDNYQSLLSQKLAIYSRLEDIREIIGQGQPVIVIVIDAMKWSIWNIISAIFEKHGFSVINQGEESTLSLIPSVTDVSRHSLFAGISYDQLLKKKLANEFTHSISNEEKHLKKYFSHSKVAFARGGKNDFKNLVSQEADIYSFIFTEADEMFHGFKDINKKLIEVLFENQIKNIAESLDKYERLAQAKIVVTTDHGSVHIAEHQSHSLDSNFKSYLENKSLNISAHGRYLKIFATEFKAEVYQEVKEYLSSNEEEYWHLISREDMADYSLPTVDDKGQNYFWLISKYGYYTGACRGDYAHGGLSLTESIIPFAILEKQARKFIAPEFKLTEINLVSQKESELEVVIINNNNYPLRELKISLEKLGVSESKSFVKSNDLAKMKMNLLPDQSGEIEDELKLSFIFAGERKEEVKKVSLAVKDSSKSRIDKSLKESRDLF